MELPCSGQSVRHLHVQSRVLHRSLAYFGLWPHQREGHLHGLENVTGQFVAGRGLHSEVRVVDASARQSGAGGRRRTYLVHAVGRVRKLRRSGIVLVRAVLRVGRNRLAVHGVVRRSGAEAIPAPALCVLL